MGNEINKTIWVFVERRVVTNFCRDFASTHPERSEAKVHEGLHSQPKPLGSIVWFRKPSAQTATFNSCMVVEKYCFIYTAQTKRKFFKTSKIFQTRINPFEVNSNYAVYRNPPNVSVLYCSDHFKSRTAVQPVPQLLCSGYNSRH